MQLNGIFIYPIKAISAVELQQAEVRPRGLAGDRRWVLVDQYGQCLHQRTQPRLATVKGDLQPDGGIAVATAGMDLIHIACPDGRLRSSVTIWSDEVNAADAGDQAAAWFTQFLGITCRLLFMDAHAIRPVAAPYGKDGDVVSFADGIPLLLASEASLADLNGRLENPLPMNRFRPNVVVDGQQPWVEEQWKRVRIGDIEFEVTHPCVRCVVTTVDQKAGEKSADREPLKTLATFHQSDDGVCFGVNMTPRGSGVIRLSDPVTVLEQSPTG